jgi:hypothetical protein
MTRGSRQHAGQLPGAGAARSSGPRLPRLPRGSHHRARELERDAAPAERNQPGVGRAIHSPLPRRAAVLTPFRQLRRPEGSIKGSISTARWRSQVPAREKAPVCGDLQSPLTDSNRRPPPYHRRAGRETRVSAGEADHENPGKRTNPTPTFDRQWTSVPGLVFPCGSLAALPSSITDRRAIRIRTVDRAQATIVNGEPGIVFYDAGGSAVWTPPLRSPTARSSRSGRISTRTRSRASERAARRARPRGRSAVAIPPSIGSKLRLWRFRL